MNDPHLEPDVRSTARHIAELSRRVEIDLQHKTRLREELLRRHQELSAETSQRMAGTLWPRFARFKRLTLVAPPALAAVIALFLVLSGLQLSGRQQTQTAEAARITAALARTVPTVTGWQLTQSREKAGTTTSARRDLWKLQPQQRLYIQQKQRQAYFYSNGKWYLISDRSTALIPSTWAFAVLVSHLSDKDTSITPGPVIRGKRTDTILYAVPAGSTRIVTTAWVDHTTGLVLRLQRARIRGGKVLERYSADYEYTTPLTR